jgi:cell shape-determining protein MreD
MPEVPVPDLERGVVMSKSSTNNQGVVMNIKNLVSVYAGIGVGVAAVSAAVLIKDGKDAPSKIAYYSTVNGVVWPVAVLFMEKKRQELVKMSS